jgi:hypothetical protein
MQNKFPQLFRLFFLSVFCIGKKVQTEIKEEIDNKKVLFTY